MVIQLRAQLYIQKFKGIIFCESLEDKTVIGFEDDSVEATFSNIDSSEILYQS